MQSIPRETVEKDILSIIRRIRPDLTGDIRASDRLRDDLGLDSLHSMELLSEVTEKYEVDVDVEQAQEVRTVGDVVTFVSSVLSR